MPILVYMPPTSNYTSSGGNNKHAHAAVGDEGTNFANPPVPTSATSPRYAARHLPRRACACVRDMYSIPSLVHFVLMTLGISACMANSHDMTHPMVYHPGLLYRMASFRDSVAQSLLPVLTGPNIGISLPY